ncbi:hypothetical protein BDY21DRAFT_58963 [Lineolata rhizophorae]|uniref:Uncharacterized protein n=1 Tax=Lineolata rhizophorae TaxID=578093 RepID=A0A6A6NXP2_9PEZI|nr:hypothetical protein BDY21DRAFT_58963 [Lineolata rhizophorae]
MASSTRSGPGAGTGRGDPFLACPHVWPGLGIRKPRVVGRFGPWTSSPSTPLQCQFLGSCTGRSPCNRAFVNPVGWSNPTTGAQHSTHYLRCIFGSKPSGDGSEARRTSMTLFDALAPQQAWSLSCNFSALLAGESEDIRHTGGNMGASNAHARASGGW